MPLKDIDWDKVAKQTQVSYHIGRSNAIINAEVEKNIPKLEWLTGKKLLERDPIAEAIQMEKIVREQQPIISKLKEISEKTISPQALTSIMQNLPAIEYDHLAEQPLAITSTTAKKLKHRRSRSDPITIDMNTDIDPALIAKYSFSMPNDIIKEVAQDKEKLRELGDQKKNLEYILKTIGAQSRYNKELKTDLQGLRKYNEALKTIMANHELIKKPAATSSSSGKGVKNRIYYTKPKELTQRLQVLLGEVQAGNNSKHIKNEIADISHHMYKKKLIKKKEYRHILTQI